MRYRWFLILPFSGLLILLLGYTFPTAAQDSELSVRIGRPAEGETFYSGADSLLYNIPINGWSFSPAFPPAELSVQLDVIQGHNVLFSQTTNPGADGSFIFHAEVNPGNTVESFTIAFQGCADKCHASTDLVLPMGRMRLRVTVTQPDGAQAFDERHITVDRSTRVQVPVQLVLVEDDTVDLAGVQVSASAYLYQWRKRGSLGTADAAGQAVLELEALSAAPTTYTLAVEPQVVNGVRYTGLAPAQLTLPPGTLHPSEVSLSVRAQQGQIAGQITFPQGTPAAALPVWAFHLPEGQATAAHTDTDGHFSFDSLAIGTYLLLPDPEALSSLGIAAQSVVLDLAPAPDAQAELSAQPAAGTHLEGIIRDTAGSALPFAWVEAPCQGCTTAVTPADGRFRLTLPDSGQVTIIASAPGFYSQAQVVVPQQSTGLVFDLVARPETITRPWGTGSITIPPESLTTQGEAALVLESGWLWGAGSEDTAIIQVNDIRLHLMNGRFALHNEPGDAAWLYLFTGGAELLPPEGTPIPISAGQMVRLAAGFTPLPVDLHPALVSALYPANTQLPVTHTWQPTLGALLRDRLAAIGLGTAQALTLVVYLLSAAALLAGPLLIIYFWLRQRRTRGISLSQNRTSGS